MNAQKIAKHTNPGRKNSQKKTLKPKKKIHLGFHQEFINKQKLNKREGNVNFKGMGFYAIKII